MTIESHQEAIMARQGNQGRVPDSLMGEYKKYENHRWSCPPDLYARLTKFCEDEERAMSWVLQKALDAYLTKKNY